MLSSLVQDKQFRLLYCVEFTVKHCNGLVHSGCGVYHQNYFYSCILGTFQSLYFFSLLTYLSKEVKSLLF